MSWSFNCVRTFANEVESIQNSSAVRDQFTMGFMTGSVIYPKIMDQTFNVDMEARLSYTLQAACQKIVTTVPSLDNCGADLNRIPDQGELREIYYTPFKQGVILDACKDKCDKRTLTEYISGREYAAGVSFGKLFDQIFWFGVPAIGEAGITQAAGTRVMDFSANPKFQDLCNADPNTIANFFSLIMSNMENPMICMGSTALEAIGMRAMSTTGDTCSDVWDCVVARMANRSGLANDAVRNSFMVHPMFDHITGIDPNNPTDEKSVIWLLDKNHFDMGLQNDEIVGCAITKGHDIVEAKRSLHMSAPHIKRQGASRWVFGFADQDKLLECEADRYDDCGDGIGLTVPTPIISAPAGGGDPGGMRVPAAAKAAE